MQGIHYQANIKLFSISRTGYSLNTNKNKYGKYKANPDSYKRIQDDFAHGLLLSRREESKDPFAIKYCGIYSTSKQFCQFLGFDNIPEEDFIVNDNFKIVFDGVGGMWLYRNTSPDPIPIIKTCKTRGKFWKMFSNLPNFDKKEDIVYGWKFKNPNEYIRLDLNNLCDLPYYLLPEFFPIPQKTQEFNDFLQHKGYYGLCKYLWSLGPIDLSISWDYTEEEKQFITELEEDKRRKEEEKKRKLEILKRTPGHCCKCGVPHATFVNNPFQDFFGYICESCYNYYLSDY